MRVPSRPIVRNGLAALDGTAGILRFVILEAIRQLYARAMFGARDLVANRFDFYIDQVRDTHMADTPVEIRLKLNVPEFGSMHFCISCRKDVEDGRSRSGLLAGQNLQHGVTLFQAGSLVDDREHFAIALMNGLGPG